jgi:hypothetical protein
MRMREKGKKNLEHMLEMGEEEGDREARRLFGKFRQQRTQTRVLTFEIQHSA